MAHIISYYFREAFFMAPIDDEHVVYAADGKIVVRNFREVKKTFFAQGSGDGQFKTPRGVAVDHRNGNIIVADNLNHRVQVIDQNGKFLMKFGSRGEGDEDGEFQF